MSFKLSSMVCALSLSATVLAAGTPPVSYQGWWWHSSQDGMGVNIGQQGDTLVVVWYHFGESGKGTYLLLSGKLKDGVLEGALERATGPAPGAGYNPQAVERASAGKGKVTFDASGKATLSYDYDGQHGEMVLERWTFNAQPLTAGKTLSGVMQINSKSCSGTETGSTTYQTRTTPETALGVTAFPKIEMSTMNQGRVLKLAPMRPVFLDSVYTEAEDKPLKGHIRTDCTYGLPLTASGSINVGQRTPIECRSYRDNGVWYELADGKSVIWRLFKQTGTFTVDAVSYADDAVLVDYSIAMTGKQLGKQQVNTESMEVIEDDKGGTLECTEQGRLVLRHTEAGKISADAAVPDYQDWWWHPSLDGMGVNIGQQGKVLVASWYHFDKDGKATYLLMSGELKDGVLEGALERATGPQPGAAYDPAKVKREVAGTAKITFSAANDAKLTYRYDGLSGTLGLQRFSYQPPQEGEALMIGALVADASQCDLDNPVWREMAIGQALATQVTSVKAKGQNAFGVSLKMNINSNTWLKCETEGLEQTGEVLSGTGTFACSTYKTDWEAADYERAMAQGTGEVSNLRIAGAPSSFDLMLDLKADSGAQCRVKGTFRGMGAPQGRMEYSWQ